MALDPEIQTLIDELRAEISALKRENAALRQENAALKQENAALRRRLNLDSGNSSKPPSVDGLKKKPRNQSLRGKSDKKSGGQQGHKGDTLRQVETPDKIERHRLNHCAHCQTPLDASHVDSLEKRQIFDISEPKLVVTEHRAEIARCPACSQISKAAFPQGVNAPTQYGPRIKAAAVYFNAQQLIPEDRAAEIMTDLFAAPRLCPASIASWAAQKSEDFEPVVEAVRQALKQAGVRHLDETGFRIGGKTQWLHVVSNDALTCYAASPKRGDIPIFLQDSQGAVVHDHFKPYYNKFAKLDHALCNAHHLRELKALIELDEEPWASDMCWLLTTANALKRQAQKREDAALPSALLQDVSQFYDLTVDMGLAFHQGLPPLEKKRRGGKKPRRPGHNLLRRLRDFKDDVMRFATDFAVPFTNNRAEQDLRMMKLRMKISGGFRSEKGAEVFAKLRSIISTARKQGWNILETLSASPGSLIKALQAG